MTNSSKNFDTIEVYVQKDPLIAADLTNQQVFVKKGITVTQVENFLTKLINEFGERGVFFIPTKIHVIEQIKLIGTDHDIEFGRKGDVIRLWHDECFECTLRDGILLLRGAEETKEDYIVSDFPNRRPKGVRRYNAI